MRKQRKERKLDECLNCGTALPNKENYCPNCGQVNNDNNIDFRQLFNDFFSHYLSLDSRFTKSIKPFFVQPGALTLEFIEGKRVKYANPIRLYIVISILHFFLLSWVVKNDATSDKNNVNIIQFDDDGVDEDNSTKLDSLGNLTDSIKNPDDQLISSYQYRLIKQLIEDDELNNEEIFDSLHVENKTKFQKWFLQRAIRIHRSTNAELQNYIVQNIPVMMFFILPLFALLLKLFFFRKGFYILHLIHSLHIHSIAFILLSICWIIVLIGGVDSDNLTPWVVLLTTLYMILSFRKVYGQKYFILTIKLLGIGLIYSILLSISLILEVIVSLAIF